MLRRLVGRVFGFAQELDELRRQVAELSWDPTFGMWTRGAFLRLCQVMPRGLRAVAFLDLAGIHQMNAAVGYHEVDRRIRAAFAIPFRRSDLVARWYSGDEIVILFDGDRSAALRKIAQLRESAAAQGLRFACAIGEWDVGRRSIEEVVGELAGQVAGAHPAPERHDRQT